MERPCLALLAAALAAACGSSPPADREDARPPAPPADAAARPADDAAPGDARLGVDCRDERCSPAELCCLTVLVEPHRVAFCVEEENSCGGGLFSCDGPEDCESDICCVDALDSVACVDSPDDCIGVRACHTDADCPAGRSCCDTDPGVIRACAC